MRFDWISGNIKQSVINNS